MRARGFILAAALLAFILTAVFNRPVYQPVLSERVKRLNAVKKLLYEPYYRLATLLIYARLELDWATWTVAVHSLNPYRVIPSSIELEAWREHAEKELEERGLKANIKARLRVWPYRGGPLSREQARVVGVKVEEPELNTGAPYLTGSLNLTLEEPETSSRVERRFKIAVVHPVRIFLLYDLWEAVNQSVHAALKGLVVEGAPSPCALARKTLKKVEKAVKETLRNEAPEKVRVEVKLTVTVLCIVKNVTVDGANLTSYRATVTVHHSTTVYELKEDAVVRVGGVVTRIAYFKARQFQRTFKKLLTGEGPRPGACVLTLTLTFPPENPGNP